jgi:hypothetical protein
VKLEARALSPSDERREDVTILAADAGNQLYVRFKPDRSEFPGDVFSGGIRLARIDEISQTSKHLYTGGASVQNLTLPIPTWARFCRVWGFGGGGGGASGAASTSTTQALYGGASGAGCGLPLDETYWVADLLAIGSAFSLTLPAIALGGAPVTAVSATVVQGNGGSFAGDLIGNIGSTNIFTIRGARGAADGPSASPGTAGVFPIAGATSSISGNAIEGPGSLTFSAGAAGGPGGGLSGSNTPFNGGPGGRSSRLRVGLTAIPQGGLASTTGNAAHGELVSVVPAYPAVGGIQLPFVGGAGGGATSFAGALGGNGSDGGFGSGGGGGGASRGTSGRGGNGGPCFLAILFTQ